MKFQDKISENKCRVLLFPLSLIYRCIVGIKNFLYDSGFLKEYEAEVFTVSAGNITTGGTGKTPFVIALSERIMNTGQKVCIISRGYKRKSAGQIVVSDGKSINNDISQTGDEPYMIARHLLFKKFTDFFVIVDTDRIRAIKTVKKIFNADVLILDDAFQQRKIRKDLDIVLLDANIFLNNRLLDRLCLPAGNLREPLKNLKRADVIIANFKNLQGSGGIRLDYGLNAVNAHYKISGIFNKDNMPVNIWDKKVISFCGIADSSSYMNALDFLKLKIKKHLDYPDHFTYNKSEIEKLIGLYDNDSCFLTTEKDFVKVQKFENFITEFPVYCLKIEFVTDWEKILGFLRN